MQAELYDAFHSRYLEDLPFWLNLAAAYPQPALELGCGTGRVLLALAQAGREIWGLDHDPAMLNLLSSRSEHDPSLQEHLILADMVDFQLPETFGLIISPCNTFSTLSAHQRKAALERIHTHLQPGGGFSASLPNPHTLAQIPGQWEPELEDDFFHPRTGNPVQVSSRYFRQAGEFVLEWLYDELLPDGSVTRTSAIVHHALTPLKTYLLELEEAGLKLQNLWGDFDRRPFLLDSPVLIWEAVRPAA
jgi:SAM-dependent methyltransferase